ncbi:hypothetical protein BFJ69_g7082 [Fusarium oxysporum]|uniref:Uncharacterized protein n=1 Tax=Fusarium oxysporum TaxID=5507 RepID=A0A420N7G2_FUSOX|nr:hypothetical protein BFJ69_g7082 [Fusarium oxysporum]
MQAREQTGQMVSAQRLLGIAEHPLISLMIQELEELLEELNEIVEKYSRSRKAHDPKRYTDKVKWFSKASKIEELRERAQTAKSNLHMAITFRVSSMVDRGNVRQEVLFHRVAQQLTYYTQETHHISQTLPRLLQGPQPMPQSSTTSLQPGTQGTTIHNKPDPPAMEENRLTETSEVFLTNNTNQTVTVIKEESFVTAAEGGLLDALREQPWAIDELDENGHAPIHITVEYYNLLGLEQLMAAKADINRQDVVGRTPLMMAARKGNDTMVQKLLGYFECRRLIGSKVDISGRTALHFAVESGSSACVRLLLEAGAPASKLNRYGEIPMQRLAWGKQEDQQEIYEIIELLRARGADIESKELHGWTPVLRVCRKGNVPVLGALVRAGASLCAIDSKQEGILHHTAYSLNFDIVHYLAEQDLEDIDPQLREISRGDTPLGCLTWIFNEYKLPEVTIPTEDQQKDFIKLYFDLLIRDLERHISTLRDVQEAIEDRDSGATTELLDLLIKRNKDGFRQDLVDWYRGLQSYVSDGQWDNLMEAICEEHDETVEKVKRAAVAREKTMTDPEMKEFF